MRLYTYLLKLQLLNALAYRFEYLSSIGRNLFFLLGSVFLWRTAYRGIDQVAGVTEAQMVTYAVVAVLMNACFTVSIDNELFGKIRAGEIALDLIRPVNLVWYWMTEDVGRSLAAVTQFALPLLAISLLFVAPPLPAGVGAGLLFLPSCALGFLLLWLLEHPSGHDGLLGHRLVGCEHSEKQPRLRPVGTIGANVAVPRPHRRCIAVAALPVHVPGPAGDLHRPRLRHRGRPHSLRAGHLGRGVRPARRSRLDACPAAGLRTGRIGSP